MKAAAKKIVIGLIGGLVLAVGIAMIVLPGPAFVVIPAGLAILATEFHWARRCKERCRERFERGRAAWRRRREARRQLSFNALED
jgi:uncharacterized protein (TIGR02611 family)